LTQIVQDTADTPLARATRAGVVAHPELTGVHPLTDGRSAFATRGLLIKAAQRSLDVQYYIWHDDISGTLLLEALLDAAQRGVRVRLLLDDNGIAGLDPTLAALDAHPNLEVRLYNPFKQRSFKALGYITDFRRLNRRMHNKSLTADNAAAVVGGRNVGDEYFGADEQVDFADLDLLAIGRAVSEVSDVFEQYWNSESACALGTVVKCPAGDAVALLRARRAALGGEGAVREYLDALKASNVVRELLNGSLSVEWVEARVLADDPAKTLGRGASDADPRLMPRLRATVGAPASRFDVVSPYFVPMAAGTEAFAELARRGVQVRVLTNSLSATDVAAVHAGYAKRRKALLRSGVKLFELKASGTPGSSLGDWVHRLGGSGASLHAKTFAVDGRRAFVGTFNFDPRSAELNTEMGYVVDSPTLAGRIHAAFESIVPQVAYEVRLDVGGALQWVDRSGNTEQIIATEPNTGLMKRGVVRVLSSLPIDALL
jgi:putative cardiolipin synthase